jgi:hypothetical protein
LNNEYGTIFGTHIEKSEAICKEFSLLSESKTETKCNRVLEANNKILVTHEVLVDNVEIADAIFWDTDTVFLMHNKGDFDGDGTRDVINQILVSAEYIQRVLQGVNRNEWSNNYYKEIVKKRPATSSKVTAEDLISVLGRKNICYIAGYLKGFRKETKGTYSKYLTIEAGKRLGAKGYGFISMNVTK